MNKKINALVMVGGKGTRMKKNIEKPLLKVNNISLIERIAFAIEESKLLEEGIFAVSPYTPKTRKFAIEKGYKILDTPGKEYHIDLKYAVIKCKLIKTLVVSGDLPFLTGELIDSIINIYRERSKPALSVVIPAKSLKKFELKPTWIIKYNNQEVIPAGINVIDGSLINEEYMEQTIYIIENIRLFININTCADFKFASKYHLFFEKLSKCPKCLKSLPFDKFKDLIKGKDLFCSFCNFALFPPFKELSKKIRGVN
ncbi:MAG: NTP transferase domain-containing protein [Promethearchaeota archaeon]